MDEKFVKRFMERNLDTMASQSIENMLMNQPLHIANHIAANRIVIQPMEGCDGTPEGGISSLTKRRYLRFAQSGAGIIWFEAVAVCAEGRANPAQLYLTEENVAEFHQLIREIKEMALHQFGFEPIVILQATHSGRYSKPTGAPRPIVAYRRAVYEEGKETQDFEVATEKYCDKLPEYFAKTAKLAAEAGFDGIDVKCCHGYLLNEFLSAFDRPGQYGGTLENRCRLYFACVDAVKENVSAHMFVTTRLNAYDGFDYLAGFGVNEKNEIDLRETKWILKQLQKKGVELVKDRKSVV